jgi:hypothetical protein
VISNQSSVISEEKRQKASEDRRPVKGGSRKPQFGTVSGSALLFHLSVTGLLPFVFD